jgi:hypothetical protein
MKRYFGTCIVCFLLCYACASSTSTNKKHSFKFSGFTLCKAIEEQGEIDLPKDPADKFSPHDSQVVAHLLFEDLSGTYDIRWEWYDPIGSRYHSSQDVLKTSQDKYVKKASAWHALTINGDTASQRPGQWQVTFFIDNEPYRTKYFTIKSPEMVVPIPPAKPTQESPNDWGLIIGIENYSHSLPSAEYAKNDAQMMKQYFTQILGIPEQNITELIDAQATRASMEVALRLRLPKIVNRNSTLYVYFSGHGAPEQLNGDPYLLPYDGDPRFLLSTGFKLDDFYNDLKKLQIKRAVVFIDACFSGNARGSTDLLVKEKAGLKRVKKLTLTTNQVVSMSASSAAQASILYEEAEHGLFTFYLLKALAGEANTNKDAWVTFQEAYDYVSHNVQKQANLKGSDQSPQITPSIELVQNLNLSPVRTTEQ